LAALLQASLPPWPLLLELKPDLVLLVVVCWAMLHGSMEGMLWGFVGGLAVDLLSGGPFGEHMLVFTLLGFLLGMGDRSLFRGNPFLTIAGAALGSVAAGTLLLGLQTLMLGQADWWQAYQQVVLPAAALNSLVAIPVYLGAQRLSARLSDAG
jgi:rod shape-determining protein MreD